MYPSTTYAVDIIFTIIREIIVLATRVRGNEDATRPYFTHNNVADVLDICRQRQQMEDVQGTRQKRRA
jgi:hypothetical protein